MTITFGAKHFSGGSNLTPTGSSGKPGEDLAQILIAQNADTATVSAEPQWTTAITVTTHVATLAVAGWVVAVEATTATSAGAKAQVQNGSPAAGTVDVAYTAGVATLTFNATDAVTACAVQVLPYAAATVTTS